MGRETGREKLEFENLPAKRGYFGQKPGGFRALGPGHTVHLESPRLVTLYDQKRALPDRPTVATSSDFTTANL